MLPSPQNSLQNFTNIELLARYDIAAPRYTSYPTVPEWPAFQDIAMWKQALASSSEALSLYIHIPFCRAACHYCACNFVVNPHGRGVEDYLQVLYHEFALIAKHLRPGQIIEQVHLGGGTPTYLSCDQLAALWGQINAHFHLADGAELSIEVDPRVTSGDQLKLLRSLGFNRLSMGIQDFDEQVQLAVNRLQSVDMVTDLFEQARALGFTGINFDLIYGLPRQSVSGFQQTIDSVIALKPDRIALFSYAHLPSLRPFQRAHIDTAQLPSRLNKFSIFVSALQAFTAADYIYIGLDHFARPDDELAIAQANNQLQRNFQGYTTKAGLDIIGFGVSSISAIGPYYFQNQKKLAHYMSHDMEGSMHPPLEKAIQLTHDDLIRRRLIMKILTDGFLRFSDLGECFADDFADDFTDDFTQEIEALRPLQADNLLEIHDWGLQTKPLGRIFLRNIASVFDAYLNKRHERLFSRTL